MKYYKFFRKYFFCFIVYAFLGWIYEVAWFLIFRNKFVNRGFLFGPYLPIYGFGVLILLLLLNKLMKKKIKISKINITPIIVFVAIFFITTIIEYISHFVLDKCFNIVLWDYSKDYLNINGRVCFAASRNFAIGGVLALYIVQPLLEKLLVKIPNKIQNVLFIILFFIFISDFIIKILKI